MSVQQALYLALKLWRHTLSTNSECYNAFPLLQRAVARLGSSSPGSSVHSVLRGPVRFEMLCAKTTEGEWFRWEAMLTVLGERLKLCCT